MGRDGGLSVDWKTEYRELMQQLGLHSDNADGARMSARIRFNPPEQTLLVRIGSLVGALTDISAGGAAFQSSSLLTKDREVKLIFDNKFQADIHIVSSFLFGADAEENQDIFRTGVKFTKEDDGFRCTVLALRLYSRASTL